MRQCDVLVLGAGAAGLMTAFVAGQRGRRVIVLEHGDRVGRKILISGGGRCNFTNRDTRPENFLSANPHFCKSALARYTPRDFVALVEKHRVPYHEKTLGQLFCDWSAQDIVRLLEDECAAGHVEMVRSCKAAGVRRADGFIVETSRGPFRAPALVVATGGLSIPKLGATAFGYDLARQFGLKVVPPRPALVPLTLSERDRHNYCDLTGVAAEVVASCGGPPFREKLLITHRGLSGPAVLQASSYWRAGEAVTVDLLPGIDVAGEWQERRQGDRSSLKTLLGEKLPKRLAERWLALHGNGALAPQPSLAALRELDAGLHRWEVLPVGTEGFEKAEVTARGVDTSALSSKTMEARAVPGLFFVGEVVDVTGHLGGYNFQWAWASGYAAGMGVGEE